MRDEIDWAAIRRRPGDLCAVMRYWWGRGRPLLTEAFLEQDGRAGGGQGAGAAAE